MWKDRRDGRIVYQAPTVCWAFRRLFCKLSHLILWMTLCDRCFLPPPFYHGGFEGSVLSDLCKVTPYPNLR